MNASVEWVVLEGQPQDLQVLMVMPAGGLHQPPGTFLIEFTTLDHSDVLAPIASSIVGVSGWLQLQNDGYPLYPAVFAFSNASIFPGENYYRTMRVRFEGLTIFNLEHTRFSPDPPSLYRLLIGYTG